MKTYKIIKINSSNYRNNLINLTLEEAKELLESFEEDYEKHPFRYKIVEEKP